MTDELWTRYLDATESAEVGDPMKCWALRDEHVALLVESHQLRSHLADSDQIRLQLHDVAEHLRQQLHAGSALYVASMTRTEQQDETIADLRKRLSTAIQASLTSAGKVSDLVSRTNRQKVLQTRVKVARRLGLETGFDEGFAAGWQDSKNDEHGLAEGNRNPYRTSTDSTTKFAPAGQTVGIVDLGFNAYGVNISTAGEDGDWIALGHVRPLRMLAAMRKVNRDHMGCADDEIFGDDWHEFELTASVVHTRALFTVEPDDSDDAWLCHWSKEAAEHSASVPVTLWRA